MATHSRYPNSTLAARKVRAQLVGAGVKVTEGGVTVLWIKPWTAAIGDPVQYRALGPDWPWRPGIKIGQVAGTTIIQPQAFDVE